MTTGLVSHGHLAALGKAASVNSGVVRQNRATKLGADIGRTYLLTLNSRRKTHLEAPSTVIVKCH